MQSRSANVVDVFESQDHVVSEIDGISYRGGNKIINLSRCEIPKVNFVILNSAKIGDRDRPTMKMERVGPRTSCQYIVATKTSVENVVFAIARQVIAESRTEQVLD